MQPTGMRAELRQRVREARWRARTLTGALRCLPDFVVVGAQRAGTTSAYAYLSSHPDVLPAARKEVHFFDLNFDRGERWYRGMFPLRAHLAAQARARRRAVLTGEASPYYLFHPLAPRRAADVVPAARLLVLLRDPVERAWSHYRHEVEAGRERLSFEDALDAEAERLRGAEEAILAGQRGPAAERHRTCSYVARGRYAEQLDRWYGAFAPEQVLVLAFEDLFRDPQAQWGAVLAFLGLAATRRPAFQVHNAGRQAPLPAAVRARLEQEFRVPNDDLAQLLGRPLPWSRAAAG